MMRESQPPKKIPKTPKKRPKPKGSPKNVASKQNAKAKAKPKSGGPTKRPAASDTSAPPGEEEEAKKKPAKQIGTKTRKDGSLSLCQSYYKDVGKYSWKVNGKECLHAPGMHRFRNRMKPCLERVPLDTICIKHNFLRLSFTKLHPVDGISSEKLHEIAEVSAKKGFSFFFGNVAGGYQG